MKPGGEGKLADWWHYEQLRRPPLRLDSAAGAPRDKLTMQGITYEEMRQGSYQVAPRLEDMDVNRLEASLCFPTFPRSCGQTFPEAKGEDLAEVRVRAYNDWMVDEWCGTSGGRLIPLTLVALWDARLAAQEEHRNAERGVRAVCFSEIPPHLCLPSIHDPDGHWDPFFQACAETGTVVNMHIGSFSKMPSIYFNDHVFGCFFDDAHGLRSVDEIGVDNITYESDYPHSDSTWPRTREIAEEQMADLTDVQRCKILRGSAIRLYGLELAA